MSDGKGSIVDGQSYQSSLPEAYAKVKHERDNVVKAFNLLKQHSDNVEAELAELIVAARSAMSIYYCSNCRTIELNKALNNLERLI
tara:strand:+ start:1454 stop:1711 length:258 start_codon:yes stop_codon:yes gene_type:complete